MHMDSREIKDHARYIKQTILDERLYQRPSTDSLDGHPDRNRSHHDYKGFMLELQDAERGLAAAHKKLSNLRQHFAKGEMLPFEDAGRAVAAACGLVAQATAALQQVSTMVETDHPPHSQEMKAQALAVRLAWAELGETQPRAVRALAKQIIAAAGLTEPCETSLSNMIKALKEESS